MADISHNLTTLPGGIRALKRLAAPRPAREVCDLCGTPLASAHRHLLEPTAHRIVCSCDACAALFPAGNRGRFKLIPRDVRQLPAFHITDQQWESLALPVNLAFFVYDPVAKKTTVRYPSPGGALESLAPLECWAALAEQNPILANIEPEVEALLVNRVSAERDYFIVPIDACYELAGLLRAHWRGFTGGEVVWQKIHEFFQQLRALTPSTHITEGAHA